MISDIPAGDGKIDNLFLQCIILKTKALKRHIVLASALKPYFFFFYLLIYLFIYLFILFIYYFLRFCVKCIFTSRKCRHRNEFYAAKEARGVAPLFMVKSRITKTIRMKAKPMMKYGNSTHTRTT